MAIVIAIDAGTTGIRTIAFDEDGQLVDSAYREFTQHFPRPGWVEHDADEIWTTAVATLAEVIGRCDGPVAAIGITNQRETVVAWDRSTGRPLHRAIVWQDRRTTRRCDELSEAGHVDLIRSTTGLVTDPYFSATKYEWLLGPGGVVPDASLALGTVDSWLTWKLTGEFVTEPSNASRTMLFDIRAGRWSPQLCDLFGVNEAMLAEVRPSSGVFGHTRDVAGVADGVPVAGIAGDQQAALFGQVCFEPGEAKNTYGTGSFVLMNVGSTCPEPVDGLLTTVAWDLDGTLTYALEGAIFVTGAAVQWLRDGLGIIGAASELEALALSCDDTGGVMFVPAFTGLGSPWWDPRARGTIVGITRGTGRAELARAVVESMVHQTRDVVDAMTTASGHDVTALRVDGGASAMGLLLQLQADQLGVTVERPKTAETTALGAAYLAGLAAGVWDSPDDVRSRWALDVSVSPAQDRTGVDERHDRWREAVSRSRDWAVD
ncbi:MAG: glycerol kinase GlpK [Acidimicrobiales bacterium]